MSKIRSSCSLRRGRKTTVLSIRFMNSGANFRFAASDAIRSTFSSRRDFGSGPTAAAKPIPPTISSVISPAPRFEVIKIIACDRSIRRLSPRVKDALSKIPRSNCQSASLAFSISSNNKKLILNSSVWYCASASWVINGRVSLWPK